METPDAGAQGPGNIKQDEREQGRRDGSAHTGTWCCSL